MKKTINIVLIIMVLVLIGTYLEARYEKLYQPIIKGNASGTRLAYTLCLDDAQAGNSQWLLGDTTAAGMFVPEQPIEIQDLKILWDPDSGDSIRVIVYAANGDLANETIVDSDTLVGSAYEMNDDFTPSATYKTVTLTEGLAIRYIAISGTPNKVNIILECKTRISDAYE